MLLSLFLAAVPAASLPTAPELSSPPSSPPVARGLQDDEDKPDKRPEVKALIERLKEHVKRRGDEDDEAVGVIQEIGKEFPESGPKDQKAMISALEKCFKEKRKELEDGSPDNRLFLAAALALGDMGEEAAKPLSKLVDHKNHRDDLDLQRRIILALGKTKSDKTVEVLLDTLKHHEPRMQAYAGEALASYAGKPLKLRKEIFEEILKIYMGVKAQVDTDTDNRDVVAQERWSTIYGPMTKTLQDLSGQEIRDAHEWQSWWNNNKKKDWGPGKEG